MLASYISAKPLISWNFTFLYVAHLRLFGLGFLLVSSQCCACTLAGTKNLSWSGQHLPQIWLEIVPELSCGVTLTNIKTL